MENVENILKILAGLGITGVLLKYYFNYQKGQRAILKESVREKEDEIQKINKKIDSTPINDLVNESNKRHGATEGSNNPEG